MIPDDDTRRGHVSVDRAACPMARGETSTPARTGHAHCFPREFCFRNTASRRAPPSFADRLWGLNNDDARFGMIFTAALIQLQAR